MRPDIPPIPFQPHFPARRPRSRNLKHPRRDLQRCIRGHNLRARHPLRHIAPLLCRDIALGTVVGVDVCEFGTGNVSEGGGGAEVREEGAVALEDVGFVRAGGGGAGGVGPGAGVFRGVGGGVGEGAEGDAEVEV